MIVSFSLERFRSFRESATLSLVANSSDKAFYSSLHDPLFVSKPDLKLLPAAIIYGANAAGKSNVLLALDYLQSAVMFSHAQWEPGKGTNLPQQGPHQEGPTRLEIEFIKNGTRYRYGFETDGKFFNDEWLYSSQTTRDRTLFRRTTVRKQDSFETTVKFGDSLSGGERYLNTIKPRVRENSLFLSAASQENQKECLKASEYITSDIFVSPLQGAFEPVQATRTSEMAYENASFKKVLVNILRIADPAIVDVQIVEASSSERITELSKALPEGLRQLVDHGFKYDVRFVLQDGDDKVILPFNAESRGVRKIYSLAGNMLTALKYGDAFVIDELESSMHPHMARLVVELFQDREQNENGAQLIVVTHDTNLLDQASVRRDQVWFVEKDQAGSHLYSLLDFSPRKDEDLERGYLRGRYGAIPALRQIELEESPDDRTAF